ncbi:MULTISPECIES: type IV secretion system protein [Sphingomonadaceae]|uniref:type IV secretion system protein n=1 Tax=Sphingomonadales TaxID=204457 RepID=UPI000A365CA6|nr:MULTISPECIES: type IV secretion system protein [Sphingomonadaceae]MEA3389328.1 type IV secretion system protein [Pseudomonadota bacterium]PHQ64601.1 MAG: type VI secretion protein [Sphingobium sp.]MBD3761816.1 type IV secretion system protein [Rhizorhabdus sp.]MCB4861777.1 type IV secretion system protein [Sphingobium sp. PNB]WRD79081.1 type IV secretion system protein [Sphingobium baderi]
MSSTIFSTIYDNVDGKLDLFLNERLSNVVDVIRGPLAAGLVIYIVLFGFMVMRGIISEPWGELFARMVKLCLLYMAATTVAYSEWITEPLFHGMPDAIAQALAGKTIGTAGAVFDQYFSQVDDVIRLIRAEAETYLDINPWKLVLLTLAIVIYAVAGLSAAIGFAITIFAKVALAIIIALGPIFIALALFEPTRRFFHGWLGQAFNYIVLMAVIIAITTLVSDLGASALAEAETNSDVTIAAVIFAVYLFLGTIFFFQAPAIATGIAGGAAAGVGAFAGTAWGTMASPFRQRRVMRNSRNLERAARRGGTIEAA